MNERDRQRRHVLTALAEAWERNPNLRFGQLVENLIKADIGADPEQHWPHCVFHITDDVALARILEGVPA